MPTRRTWRLALLCVAWPATSFGAGPPPAARMLDLADAVIVVGPGSKPLLNAGEFLRSEIEERTGLSWAVVDDWKAAAGRPAVGVGARGQGLGWTGPMQGRLGRGHGPDGSEGFRIETDPAVPGVVVLGNDSRGTIFGIGRLLRELRLGPKKALLPADFSESTAPKAQIRGHQLGYRPKTNSYDGWDRAQWRRYIRDLTLFGTNAVELLPPRTDDDARSPHFPLPPLEMMTQMSSICETFDLDVWVWFPAMDADYRDPAKVETALKEWDSVFRAMPRLDDVFVPGGDPGHTEPKVLFALLEQATRVLHRSHPKARMWVSPQGFNAAWYDEFIGLLNAGPEWLTGLVYGPQTRVSLPELRSAAPSRYKIRGYPDVTHTRQCQHPVPDWDLAFAATEGREPINPRPLAQAELARAYLKDTVGFITYSEGCNDDVNKFVWSALGWDPGADVVGVLRQYARTFLDDDHADAFAQALLALERNWSGPLLSNTSVETTLAQLRDLERTARPSLRLNWRFQQALYRGYYDAYLRDRLIHETALEAQARELLRQAPAHGSAVAIRRASEVLDRATTEPVSLDRRARVFELAEALFQSVRMQLSVPRYQAIEAERGANLDTIDAPLNNRPWLTTQFSSIGRLPTEPERLRALVDLLNRGDPGPGGFYDDLGDPANSPHLVRLPPPAGDPFLSRAAVQGFEIRPDWPTAWRQFAQTYHNAPLRLRYDGLDPSAVYRVRVVYAGDSPSVKIRMEADGKEVHPLLTKSNPPRPEEFDLPPGVTADGGLDLSWTAEPGRGGNGRGCQVAEVWLIRSPGP